MKPITILIIILIMPNIGAYVEPKYDGNIRIKQYSDFTCDLSIIPSWMRPGIRQISYFPQVGRYIGGWSAYGVINIIGGCEHLTHELAHQWQFMADEKYEHSPKFYIYEQALLSYAKDKKQELPPVS